MGDRRTFSLKMAREALCTTQTDVGNNHVRSAEERHGTVDRLQQMIDLIDHCRPLGPGGEHGDRHTALCGCQDDR